MAVTKTWTIVAVWVAAGVVLVAVLVVLLILCMRYQRRRRQRHYLAALDKDVSSEDASPWSTRNLFPGFQRLTGADVTTDPAAGVYGRPRVVHVCRIPVEGGGSHRADLAHAPCDILVNVFYADPSTTNATGLPTTILGSDGWYSTAFLLYTAPLEFVAPGTYAIQAHTVYYSARAVGPVHQFIFCVTDSAGDGGAWPAGALTIAGPGAQNRANTIDINLARSAAGQLVAADGARSVGARSPEFLSRSLSRYGPGASLYHDQAVYLGVPPLAPTITPAEGTVTTRTPITISPNERSTTADQLRYSIDGSHPTVLYTGPFTLSLPPESILPSQRQTVRVRAMAVVPSHTAGDGGYASTSTITEVELRVRPAGYSFFDPDIPAPATRLRAVDATLYFDESANPAGCRTVYQLLYVNEVRRRKAKFSRRHCRLYERTPIPIHEDVALVYAWTVTEEEWSRGGGGGGATGRSRAARASGLVYSDSEEDMDVDGGLGARGGYPGRQLRSVATVYDCARAATEQARPSRRRAEQLNAHTPGAPPMRLLPAPVVCVSCAELEIAFEDAPANSVIAYTLDGTEPALYDVTPPACARPVASAATASHVRHSRSRSPPRGQPGARQGRTKLTGPVDDEEEGEEEVLGDEGGFSTRRYTPGELIRVTLLETEGVHVTARLFMPIYASDGVGGGTVVGSQGGQGGSAGTLLGYRYGNVFRRGFFFSE